MNRSKNNAKLHTEKGIGVIELAFVLPLCLLLILGSLEYARLIITYQDLSQISKEVANIVYRSCAGAGLSESEISACIESSTTNYIAALELPNGVFDFTILASVYDTSAGSLKFAENAINKDTSVLDFFGVDLALSSQYCWSSEGIISAECKNDIEYSSALRALLTDVNAPRALSFAELFVSYEPLTNFIPGFERQMIYESTMY